MTQPHCRFCAAPLTLSLVDLGNTPLSNAYLPPHKLAESEPSYPLHARVCGQCRLVQVEAAETPQEIFGQYAYFSSYSSSWVAHARRFAQNAMQRWSLDSRSLVMEVASNDGYLLKHFVEFGVPVLGVEPAANVAAVAQAAGIPSEVAFFGRSTAQHLAAHGQKANLIVANNVLAHVPDINDFVSGFPLILRDDGVLSLEFPHLLRLIEGVQFDTIYHEHFSYLSLLTVEHILERHGLRVFDVEELSTHGGSLRVSACHAQARHAQGPGLTAVRAQERAAGLDHDDIYTDFAPRVVAVRDQLLVFLAQARKAGQRVAAYGAAAKGNTLLNYCGVGRDLIDYVVDLSPHKQGLFMPGSRLPILSPDKLLETRPDYVLILPWNIAGEIQAQWPQVREWGGRFMVPIPEVRVLP